MSLIILKYEADFKNEWDSFIDRSKNGVFFFKRDFMEYHSNRFSDHSLIIFYKNKIVCVLPANKKDQMLVSHGGLTFGGLISDNSMTTPLMLNVFEALKSYCLKNNIKKIIYKSIPYIYHKYPAGEDLYALFTSKATLINRDITSVIDLYTKLPYQERRARAIIKAKKSLFNIEESKNENEWAKYWHLLNENLKKKYNKTAVHTKEEILLLKNRFPDKIRLYLCKKGSEMAAGVVLFINPTNIHAQYISVNEEHKKNGALDLLFDHILMDTTFQHQRYFDFGISNEHERFHLNKGLIEQKEGFGARAVVHDTYELTIN